MTARMGTVRGTGGSVAYTDIQYYPAVPYAAIHFHPICYLNDNTKINEARNCELLNTLNQVRLLSRSSPISPTLLHFFRV